MKLSVGLVFAVIVSLVVPALAEKLTIDGASVVAEVPTGWKTTGKTTSSEGVLVAISPDEEASIVFALSESGNLEAAIKAIDKMLAKVVTDAKVDKAGPVTINGMKGLAAKGTAKAKGKPVKTGVLFLETKSKKILVVIGLVNAAKEAAYKKTFDEVLASIKPN